MIALKETCCRVLIVAVWKAPVGMRVSFINEPGGEALAGIGRLSSMFINHRRDMIL